MSARTRPPSTRSPRPPGSTTAATTTSPIHSPAATCAPSPAATSRTATPPTNPSTTRTSDMQYIPPANLRGHDVARSEEHTSELQSQSNLVCRLLLEKKKANLSALHHTANHHII